jgi:chromosome segregation ATPase
MYRMTINLETLIPVLAAAVGVIGTMLWNGRIQMSKIKSESAKSGAEAGAITAKSEADIFQRKWDAIVSALEKRVEGAENAEEEARVQLKMLQASCEELQRQADRAKRSEEEAREQLRIVTAQCEECTARLDKLQNGGKA